MSGRHHQQQQQDQSGTGSGGQQPTSTHQLRKRHSPNIPPASTGGASSKKEESSTGETASYSKLRRVAAGGGSSSSKTTAASRHAAEVPEEKEPASSGGHKRIRENELKYLTDYFPESAADGPLTRSRLKAVAESSKLTSGKEKQTDKTSGKKTNVASESTGGSNKGGTSGEGVNAPVSSLDAAPMSGAEQETQQERQQSPGGALVRATPGASVSPLGHVFFPGQAPDETGEAEADGGAFAVGAADVGEAEIANFSEHSTSSRRASVIQRQQQISPNESSATATDGLLCPFAPQQQQNSFSATTETPFGEASTNILSPVNIEQQQGLQTPSGPALSPAAISPLFSTAAAAPLIFYPPPLEQISQNITPPGSGSAAAAAPLHFETPGVQQLPLPVVPISSIPPPDATTAASTMFQQFAAAGLMMTSSTSTMDAHQEQVSVAAAAAAAVLESTISTTAAAPPIVPLDLDLDLRLISGTTGVFSAPPIAPASSGIAAPSPQHHTSSTATFGSAPILPPQQQPPPCLHNTTYSHQQIPQETSAVAEEQLSRAAAAAADLRQLASQLAAVHAGAGAAGGADAALLQAAAANVMDLTTQMLAATGPFFGANSALAPPPLAPALSQQQPPPPPQQTPVTAAIGFGGPGFAPLPQNHRHQQHSAPAPLPQHTPASSYFQQFLLNSTLAAFPPSVPPPLQQQIPGNNNFPSSFTAFFQQQMALQQALVQQQQQQNQQQLSALFPPRQVQLQMAPQAPAPIGIQQHQHQGIGSAAESLVSALAAAASNYGGHYQQQLLPPTLPPPSTQPPPQQQQPPPLSFSGLPAIANRHLNRAQSFLSGIAPRMQRLLSNSNAGSAPRASDSSTGTGSSGGGAGGGGISIRDFRGGLYGYMEDPEVAVSAIISTMEGLRSTNEIRQSEAATELAEMLLMGNEESLPGLPIREIVQHLMRFLQKDHNFELMLTAARCITNMQEALPRAIPLLAECIPLLLQKLKRIEYIDVAEQSLIALEVMSRRNAKNILNAGGISATISHVDFFSLPSQRLVFAIAANCACYVTNNDFGMVKDCLGDLTQRLVYVEDKRCVESICLFFTRIIENVRNHAERLRQIAGANYEFLKNVQHLITLQPLTISSATFLNLLKSIRYMCSKCGDISVALIKMDFGNTLQTLLLGHEKSQALEKSSATGGGSSQKQQPTVGFGTPTVDVMTRPPQQFREIIVLIGELMPVLPSGKASVDPSEKFAAASEASGGTGSTGAIDDSSSSAASIDNQVSQFYSSAASLRSAMLGAVGVVSAAEIVEAAQNTNAWFASAGPVPGGAASTGAQIDWIPLSQAVSEMLEASRLLGEPQTVLEMDGEVYDVDFLRMVRRNTTTGVETLLDRRPQQATGGRQGASSSASSSSAATAGGGAGTSGGHSKATSSTPIVAPEPDERDVLKRNENQQYAKLVRALMPLLVDIGANSTCPSLRHELLRVMLRMVFAVDVESSLEKEKVGGTSGSSRKRHTKIVEDKGDDGDSEGGPKVGGLHEILRDIPLAVYLYNTISTSMTSTRMMGVLVNAIRLVHALLDKLPQLYIPLFETEGVFYELKKVTKLPPPPLTPSNSSSQLNRLVPGGTSTSSSSNIVPGSTVTPTGTLVAPGGGRHHHRSTASITIRDGDRAPQLAMRSGAPASGGSANTAAIASTPLSSFSAFLQQQQQNSATTLTNPPIMFSTNAGAIRAISAITGQAAGGGSSLTNVNQAKQLHEWAVKEANRILQKYTGEAAGRKHGILPHKNASKVYEKLCAVAKKFTTQGKDVGTEPLNTFRNILLQHEISAFQLTHSGIVAAVNVYLADPSTNIFPARRLRLKRFAAVFMNITVDNVADDMVIGAKERFAPFECLITKVLHAIGQVEQFQVKITNLTGFLPPGASSIISAAGILGTTAGGNSAAAALLSTSYLRGVQALRFFQTHQLRINLRRHPSIAPTPTKPGASAADVAVREWRHGRGSIKVDPLTSVEKIERYLLERGMAGTGSGSGALSGGAAAMNEEAIKDPSDESSEDNDEISDEEQDVISGGTGGGGEGGGGPSSHHHHHHCHHHGGHGHGSGAVSANGQRVELYIGESRLPSDMPIIQAIRQFSLAQDEESQESIPATLWVMPHTIYYKPATPPSIPAADVDTIEQKDEGKQRREKSPSPMDTTESGGGSARTTAREDTSAPGAIGSRRVTRAGAGARSQQQQQQRQQQGSSKDKEKSGSPSPAEHAVWIREHPVYRSGQPGGRPCPLEKYLLTSLGAHEEALGQDPSAPCLLLLNTLYGLNNYWWALFTESEAGTGTMTEQHDTFTVATKSQHHHRSKANPSPPSVQQQPPILPRSHGPLLAPTLFHSSKLNSKVTRQLGDFLSVATQRIPPWTVSLVKAVPFVFPFSTRRSFLYSTAFGRDRALMHLCSEGGGDDHEAGAAGATTNESATRLIHRLERRKVTIKRESLLTDAASILLNTLGNFRPVLEVGFEGEVGTGYGPTLEFYSTLSRALQRHSLELWGGEGQEGALEEEEPGAGGERHHYTVAEGGLFPRMNVVWGPPASLMAKSVRKTFDERIRQFEFVGRLLAQALIDSRMLDIQLAPAFFKWLLGEEASMGVDDFERLEPGIYKSLRAMCETPAEDFDNMDIYFTYPGRDEFEMVKGGGKQLVSSSNLRQFIDLCCFWRLVELVRPEMEAVRRGFQMAVPNIMALRIFSADEMEQLFCGSAEASDETDRQWTRAALQQAIRPDHGFSHDSMQIGWLLDMLQGYSREKRRRFLQFVTGSPRLPVGGFRALNPPLTVVRKTPASTYAAAEQGGELPSAMTCYNYLKIPPYDSYDVFVQRFDIALEHVFSFYLT